MSRRRTSLCCTVLSFMASSHALSTGTYISKVVQNTLANAFSTNTEPAKIGPSNSYVVFGLGNIGASYVNTRHNVGRDIINKLAGDMDQPLVNDKHVCNYSNKFKFGNNELTIAVPDTYMNLSGRSVRSLSESLSIPQSNVIVIHDDLDMAVGQVKIRNKGTSGGQNGIKDILNHLKQDSPFVRIKIGIGRPSHPNADISDYVLGKFNGDDRRDLNFVTTNIKNIIEWIINEGAEKAHNKYQLKLRQYLISIGKIADPSKNKVSATEYKYDPARVGNPQKKAKKAKDEDLYAQLSTTQLCLKPKVVTPVSPVSVANELNDEEEERVWAELADAPIEEPVKK